MLLEVQRKGVLVLNSEQREMGKGANGDRNVR